MDAPALCLAPKPTTRRCLCSPHAEPSKAKHTHVADDVDAPARRSRDAAAAGAARRRSRGTRRDGARARTGTGGASPSATARPTTSLGKPASHLFRPRRTRTPPPVNSDLNLTRTNFIVIIILVFFLFTNLLETPVWCHGVMKSEFSRCVCIGCTFSLVLLYAS